MTTEPARSLPQLAVACPACASPAGELCTSHSGKRTRRNDTHLARRAAWVEAGKPAPVEGETAEPAELTIYRASHDAIVMGRYTNRDAARKHCETVLRREVGPDVFLGWVPDDGSEHAAEELCIGHDVLCSGYIVKPLTVDSEYDEEADE
ncbi:hypothetical protein [Streptomyces sp. RTd22]|uniref:zinc finger domain-containing protein n=1 Tax=Streptomyces sp. RTd22 TaxID=1841249 RepID=UPI0007C46E60|nr:hypothetical protein [Streptomyces sp. RTd22]